MMEGRVFDLCYFGYQNREPGCEKMEESKKCKRVELQDFDERLSFWNLIAKTTEIRNINQVEF